MTDNFRVFDTSFFNIIAEIIGDLNILIKPFIDVKDFGAKGNGITDDSAAINAAIQYASSLGQVADVFFPIGNYLIQSSITLANNVWLLGQGSSGLKAVITVSGAINGLVYSGGALTSLTGGGIKDISLFATNGALTGININWATRYYIDEVFCQGFATAGFWFNNTYLIWVNNCIAQFNGVGFYADTHDPTVGNNALQFNCCFATQNTTAGWQMLTFSGCKFTSSEASLCVTGFDFGNTSSATNYCQFLHIVNCLADSVTGNGYRFRIGSAVALKDVAISNGWAGSCGLAGLSISNASTGFTINGFIFDSMTQQAVSLTSCSNLILTGCTIVNYDKNSGGFAAIALASCTNCVVANCTIPQGVATGAPITDDAGCSANIFTGINAWTDPTLTSAKSVYNGVARVTGTPVGTLTPIYKQEFSYNQSTNQLYISTGLTNTSWSLVGNGNATSPALNINMGYQIAITNVSFPVVRGTNTPTGTTLYTVPASRKAVVCGASISTSGAANCNLNYVVSAVTVQTAQVVFAGANLVGQTGSTTPIVLGAGDTVVWITSASTACPTLLIIEFDNIPGLATSALGTLAVGDNTLYTVTAGKNALLFGSSFTTAGQSPITYTNYSGGNRAVNLQIVPNGGATGNTHYVAVATAQATTTSLILGYNASYPLSAGDFVVVNTDANTATQTAWCNHYEY